MQRPFLFFIPLLCCVFLLTDTRAQTASHRLHTADSLFQARRYTQSLEHYEEILRQQQYSPAMLLKMAYIHEGLEQTGPALYYLNLYHLTTRDDAVLARIDELAQKHNLRGYASRDTDRLQALYHDNHVRISIALAALALLFLSLMYRTRVKLHSRPLASGIAVAVTTIILAVHLFAGTPARKAIIASAPAYIMAGPSAGAPVVDITGDGHRVEIVGKEDVWLKIRWENREAYVRNSAVREVGIFPNYE